MRKRKKGRILRRIICVILLALIGGGLWYGYQVKQQVDAVQKWEPEVKKATAKYNISGNEELVMAIILTESKGGHLDLMQSSESRYGTSTDITTSEESIDAGVDFLAQTIQAANEKNCDIWTAIQAYNFGLAYVDFIANNGGKNTLELAEKYSKETLAPTLGNTTAKTYDYYSFPSIFHNKRYLYSNGGNFYYAELVKMNQYFIRFL